MAEMMVSVSKARQGEMLEYIIKEILDAPEDNQPIRLTLRTMGIKDLVDFLEMDLDFVKYESGFHPLGEDGDLDRSKPLQTNVSVLLHHIFV